MSNPVKKVPIHLQSAQNRIIIKNGTVVNDDSSEVMDVYIEDCRIKQMGAHLIIPGGTRVIDATGKYVFPGGIDANVHFETPYVKGNTRTIDDFYQGTRAALAGGTTTVIDCVMPGQDESLVEAYNKWRGWADEKVCCDYGLKVALPGEITEDSLKEMKELSGEEFGINTFSMSMAGENMLNDQDLHRGLEYCAEVGCLAQVHAESGEIIERNTKRMQENGVTGPEGFAMAHSIEAEEEAVMRASTLANQVNCPLLLKGITSDTAADIVKVKKNRGNVLYAEVTPAALVCDGNEYWNACWNHAASYVTSPPLRKGVTEALVEATNDSAFDIISSDHATFNKKQRALGVKDFTNIPQGVNGVGERMMILWDKLVHSGKGSPQKFVALTSANAAKLFNLYPDKGRVEIGSQADLVVWDPNATKTISVENHNLKTDSNVFNGVTVHGVPDSVVISGRIAIDEGQLRVMQGFGKFLPMAPFAPHVYEKVRAKEAEARSTTAVIRAEINVASNGNSAEEMPPPTPTKSDKAEKATSQQESNFDLKSHPNGEQNMPAQTRATSVRIRAPPGGQSSGFW